jgi:hypothetical protein
VGVRLVDGDSMSQERIPISELDAFLATKI